MNFNKLCAPYNWYPVSMERSNLESAWVRLAGPAAPSTFTMDSNQVGLPSLGAKIRMVPSTVYGAEGSSKGVCAPFLQMKHGVGCSAQPTWQALNYMK